MQDVLERCLKLAKSATSKEVKEASSKIAQVDETILRANKKLKNLFGFEETSRPAIVAHVGELERERARLQSLAKYGEFGCLSFAPFSWRDAKTKYPRLAIFSLDSPRFEISAQVEMHDAYNGDYWVPRRRYKGKISPTLPPVIAKCYSDVLERLMVTAKEKRKSVFLATSYVGLIPDETRAKIADAKKLFKDIFIIAEGKNWELTEKKPKVFRNPNAGDPLVAGFDGTNLWVIDAFNLTSIERLIKSEFTA